MILLAGQQLYYCHYLRFKEFYLRKNDAYFTKQFCLFKISFCACGKAVKKERSEDGVNKALSSLRLSEYGEIVSYVR
jgi:hypothetical protein